MVALAASLAVVMASPKYDLVWDAPPECPDASLVRARVQAYVDDAGGATAPVVAHGRVVAEAGAWVLTLTIDAGKGSRTRRLRDTDCGGLAEAAALWVALAARPSDLEPSDAADARSSDEAPRLPEPEADSRGQIRDPEPRDLAPGTQTPAEVPARAHDGLESTAGTDGPVADPLERREEALGGAGGSRAFVPLPHARPPATPAPTSLPPAVPPVPATTTRPRTTPSIHGRLRVEGGGSLGWLPIGGDLGLAFAIEVGHARIELRGLAAIRRPVRFDAPSTSGIDISAALGGIDGCGVLQLRAWFGLQLCGGLEAGMVQARPIALIDAPRFVRRPWVALSASVRTLFQVHTRIGLWLAPELVVAFTRIAFIVTDEPDPLARSQWVGGRLRAGVEVRLW